VAADVTKQPECLHVAQRVDHEDVCSKCRRAHGRQRDVGQRRVRGTCVQEQEKDREKHRDPRRGKRNVKGRNEKRTGDEHPDSRDQEVRTRETRSQSIGDDAAQKRRDQTRDHGD